MNFSFEILLEGMDTDISIPTRQADKTPFISSGTEKQVSGRLPDNRPRLPDTSPEAGLESAGFVGFVGTLSGESPDTPNAVQEGEKREVSGCRVGSDMPVSAPDTLALASVPVSTPSARVLTQANPVQSGINPPRVSTSVRSGEKRIELPEPWREAVARARYSETARYLINITVPETDTRYSYLASRLCPEDEPLAAYLERIAPEYPTASSITFTPYDLPDRSTLTARLVEAGAVLGWTPPTLEGWMEWAGTAPVDKLTAQVLAAENRAAKVDPATRLEAYKASYGKRLQQLMRARRYPAERIVQAQDWAKAVTLHEVMQEVARLEGRGALII